VIALVQPAFQPARCGESRPPATLVLSHAVTFRLRVQVGWSARATLGDGGCALKGSRRTATVARAEFLAIVSSSARSCPALSIQARGSSQRRTPWRKLSRCMTRLQAWRAPCTAITAARPHERGRPTVGGRSARPLYSRHFPPRPHQAPRPFPLASSLHQTPKASTCRRSNPKRYNRRGSNRRG